MLDFGFKEMAPGIRHPTSDISSPPPTDRPADHSSGRRFGAEVERQSTSALDF
jgi:hypothetical protein